MVTSQNTGMKYVLRQTIEKQFFLPEGNMRTKIIRPREGEVFQEVLIA